MSQDSFIPPKGYVFPGCGTKLQRKLTKFPVKRYFEYHCWESEKSHDAELWHHTHQRCVVLRRLFPHEADYEMYEIKFADGFTACATWDEILQRKDQFCRPDYVSPQAAC